MSESLVSRIYSILNDINEDKASLQKKSVH